MNLALIFFSFGILFGAIYGILKGLVYIFNRHFVAQLISDLLFSCIVGFGLLFVTNIHNMGEFRLYFCIFCALGFVFERKSFGKLFAKLAFMLYNASRKRIANFKSTRFGKIIFK